MEIMDRLHQSIGTGTSIGDHDSNYRLMAYGLVRFRDKIYVLDCSELNKIILREFHVKPYSGHPRY